MTLNQPATVALLAVLLAPVANILISFIKSKNWPKQLNAVVAIVVSGIGGVVLWYITGSMHGVPTLAQVTADGALIFTAAQTIYQALGFKDSWLDQVLAQVALFSKPQLPAAPLRATPVLSVQQFHQGEAGPDTSDVTPLPSADAVLLTPPAETGG